MQSVSDTPSTDQTAPPAVRVVIPTREPGAWFDDVITSLADQDYPNLSISLVHDEGERALLKRHRESIEALDLVEAGAKSGFGAKVNAVAEAASEPLLLIHHDDVAMEPGTVSALVREWLRRKEPRSLVAAKLVDWSDHGRLMPAGFDADRFGTTAPIVRPGDLDQGQQDRVTDIFGTSTACVLIDREFFVSIGGFDTAVDWHGEAFDLALRIRSVGGQVVIPANAPARHRGAFDGRGGASTTYRTRRHQLRATLGAAPLSALPGLLLGFIALHLIEFITALARFDLPDALSIPAAWLWNLLNGGSLLQRRSTLMSIDTFSADDPKLVRHRGSLRISESLDRRVSQREIATEQGENTISVIRVAGGIVIGALLAFGARHLLTRDIPEIGEFRAVPDDLGTLTTEWLSGFRLWGMGSEGFASFGLPLLDLLGILTFGSATLLRTVLLIAPIPIGVIGAWKLFNRSPSDLAPVAAAAVYAASPLPYNAISGGSLTATILYALFPWIIGNVAALAGSTTIGPLRSRRAATAALSLLLAIVLAFLPGIALLFLLAIVGMVVGSLLSGDMRGVLSITIGSVIATAIAIALNLPAILSTPEWSQLVSAQTTELTATPLTDLLVLVTGPAGHSLLGWAVFAPALFPLLSGIGQRFTWALRFWGAMLAVWALAWASARGFLPVGLPANEIVLVPVAVGFAGLAGLAGQVIDTDVSEAKARRGIPAAIAVIGFVIAMIPLFDSTSTGRWELARTDLATTYSALVDQPEDGTYRVLWIGDAHVLGASSVPSEQGLAWTTSLDGVPDIRALWGGPTNGATGALADVVASGLTGETSRFGRQLAPFGIRYIVVMDQQAPVPEVSRRVDASSVRAASLNGQLDLVAGGVVNPAVAIFENTAWAPVHSAVAPPELEARQFSDAAPAVVTRENYAVFSGQTRLERNVYASWEDSPRWSLTVGDRAVPRLDLGDNVGMGFETADLTETAAVLAYETSDSHQLTIAAQSLGWLLLLAVRRWTVGEKRRVRRDAAIRTERVG